MTRALSGRVGLFLAALLGTFRPGGILPAQPPNPFGDLRSASGPLTATEIDALGVLVRHRADGRSIAWLREALADPVEAARLVPRAGQVGRAVLGFDEARRAGLETWLVDHLANAAPSTYRADLAQVLLDLGGASPKATRSAVAALLVELDVPTPRSYRLELLFDAFVEAARRLPFAEARAVSIDAADGFVKRLAGCDDLGDAAAALRYLARLLRHGDGEDARRLRREAAKHTLAAVRRGVGREKPAAVRSLVEGLVGLLDRDQAEPILREAAPPLLAAAERDADRDAILGWADGLGWVATGLPPEEAHRIGARLRPHVLRALGTLTEESDGEDLVAACRRLPGVVRAWATPDATRVCEEAADRLYRAALREHPPSAATPVRIDAVIELLAALPDAVAGPLQRTILSRLVRKIEATPHAPRLGQLAGYLGRLVTARPTPEGVAACRKAARDLVARLAAVATVAAAHDGLFSLTRVADRVDPVLTERLLELTGAAADRWPASFVAGPRVDLAAGFAELAPFLSGEEVVNRLLPLLELAGTSGDHGFFLELAGPILAGLDRLETPDREGRTRRVAGAFERVLPGPIHNLDLHGTNDGPRQRLLGYLVRLLECLDEGSARRLTLATLRAVSSAGFSRRPLLLEPFPPSVSRFSDEPATARSSTCSASDSAAPSTTGGTSPGSLASVVWASTWTAEGSPLWPSSRSSCATPSTAASACCRTWRCGARSPS